MIGAQRFTLGVGEIIKEGYVGDVTVTKDENAVHFHLNGFTTSVPMIGPLTQGKAARIIRQGALIYVTYGSNSSWPEFQSFSCAAGIILVVNEEFKTLPDVKPDTFVIEDGLGQLVIGRVEKTPFGTPCAALLDLENLQGNIEEGYYFPEKAIIVESITSTAPNHCHSEVCIPGTGPSYGDVPYIYPWVSPDGKMYGWAAALFQEWEVQGIEKPTDEKLAMKIRQVAYDSVDPNEEYELYLGETSEERVKFQILSDARGGGTYYREAIEHVAKEHRNRKLALR